MSQTLGDAHEPVAAVDGFEIRPQIKPLSDVMAAEVVGIDLSQPMAQAIQEQIHAAFLTYKVLAFRNQTRPNNNRSPSPNSSAHSNATP